MYHRRPRLNWKQFSKKFSFVRRSYDRTVRAKKKRKGGIAEIVGEIFGEVPKMDRKKKNWKVLHMLWMKEFLAIRRKDLAQFLPEARCTRVLSF